MSERLCLVTGACGFSGSHLVKLLLASGEKVIATDLEKGFQHPKNAFIFERIGLDLEHPNLTVLPANLLAPETLERLFEREPTHVFHTASLYDYSAPMETLRRVNVDGSRNLFEIASRKKLRRFVHWSTCGVYGKPYTARDGARCNVPFSEQGSSPRNAAPEQREPTGTHLVNDYSITKWEQEKLAWRFHRERGLPLTVIRPGPLYGPGSDYGHGGIILAVNKGLVPFLPKDSRNYISTSVHVEDIARFASFIALGASGVGEDYNVVDDSIISYYEFVRYIALLLGRRMWDLPAVNLKRAQPILNRLAALWLGLEKRFSVPRLRVFEVGSTNYISSSYWLSNSKSKQAGFTYKWPDVKVGLRETVHWFRDAGWLDRAYNPKALWLENVAPALAPASANGAPELVTAR